jgi:hypothetical protein
MKFFKKHWFFVVLAMALVILSFSFNALASDKEPNTDTVNYAVEDCTNSAADEQTATTTTVQAAACPTAVNDSASCNTSDCFESGDTAPSDCAWFKQISDRAVNTKDAEAAASDTAAAKNCSDANCDDCADCTDCVDCVDCADCSNCADENCSGNECAANTRCVTKTCANNQATEKNKCNSNAVIKSAAFNPATVTVKTCANLSLDDCLKAVTSAGDYAGLLNQCLGNNCAPNGQAVGNCIADNGNCPSGNTGAGSPCPSTNNTCPSTTSGCPYANQ